MKTEKIGIVGLGTVGTGTLKILVNQRESIHEKTGVWIDVKKACDININRNFDFDFDKNILTTNYNDIINDPEISVVVELIGGYTFAKDVILKALNAKKNVVTANKALIAKFSKELFTTAKQNNVKIYYEASVGGGIPIITPLQESLVANNIISIKGIINGTANYILTEMTQKGLEFNDVLKKAQELGYAEADPTFDIEGIDTAHKISILSALAYGGYVDFEKIYVEGITKITKEDIRHAGDFGYNIKLLAVAKRHGEEIEVRVQPTLIPKTEILANVNDVFNSIEVVGDYVGKTLFYGRGAGMNPTGSAVVADIVKLSVEDLNAFKPIGNFYFNVDSELNLKDYKTCESKYYIRFSVKDKVGILAYIAEKFKNKNISIEALFQNSEEKENSGYVSLILITHQVLEKNIREVIEEIRENQDINIDKSILLKIDA